MSAVVARIVRLRVWGTILVLVLGAGSLGACASDGDGLTIYSGRDEALVGPLLDRFSEESGIDIDVRYGDSADLALLIAEEGENSPADLFFSQSPGAMEFLAGQDLLEEIPADDVETVDARFVDQDRFWAGITGRQRVLVYNTELLSENELPDSVLDLTDASFEGRVGVAPSNSSFQDFVTAMRQTLGDSETRAWLQGMAENDSPTFPDNSSIVDAVARGEIEMGLVNHYYNYRHLAEDPDAPSRNHVFPGGDIGALVIEAAVGIVGATDGAEDARSLIRFLLEDASQEYFAEETFEYPLVEGVEASPELPPFDSLDVPAVDIRDLGDLQETVEMIEDSGLR